MPARQQAKAGRLSRASPAAFAAMTERRDGRTIAPGKFPAGFRAARQAPQMGLADARFGGMGPVVLWGTRKFGVVG